MRKPHSSGLEKPIALYSATPTALAEPEALPKVFWIQMAYWVVLALSVLVMYSEAHVCGSPPMATVPVPWMRTLPRVMSSAKLPTLVKLPLLKVGLMYTPRKVSKLAAATSVEVRCMLEAKPPGEPDVATLPATASPIQLVGAVLMPAVLIERSCWPWTRPLHSSTGWTNSPAVSL